MSMHKRNRKHTATGTNTEIGDDTMTEQALEARRLYKREWARRNREKVRGYQNAYWERLAAQQAHDTQPDSDATQTGDDGQ